MGDALYVLCTLISIIIILYGLMYYFSTYDLNYVDTEAVITEVDCSSAALNNSTMLYDCVIGVTYEMHNRQINNHIAIRGVRPYNVGDVIKIMVDRQNVLNVRTEAVPYGVRGVLITLFGLLLLIVVTGSRFIDL
jgi:hypothetical protein